MTSKDNGAGDNPRVFLCLHSPWPHKGLQGQCVVECTDQSGGFLQLVITPQNAPGELALVISERDAAALGNLLTGLSAGRQRIQQRLDGWTADRAPRRDRWADPRIAEALGDGR